jgi:hypothetical protein
MAEITINEGLAWLKILKKRHEELVALRNDHAHRERRFLGSAADRELTDSTLKEGNGPTSESTAGEVFCGDALAHAPTNVGTALAESIVVEFKGRQSAR